MGKMGTKIRREREREKERERERERERVLMARKFKNLIEDLTKSITEMSQNKEKSTVNKPSSSIFVMMLQGLMMV